MDGQGHNYLFLSALDYRTPRRTSLHFIADELAKRGKVRFFSLRYSALSKWKRDIRLILDSRANQVEDYQGVECFLWKTPIHPFNARSPWLKPVEDALFWTYQRMPHPVLVEWLQAADTIIFESGLAPIYFDLACELNPLAKKIYRASDDLETIQAADYIRRTFSRIAPSLDAICMLSPRLAENIKGSGNLYYVPNGVRRDMDVLGDPAPFGQGLHAVSVGSMLFDPACIEIASQAFPDITFHVIGSGRPKLPGYGDNVRVYGDMEYRETLRYIKHAVFGLAPYIAEHVPSYLADSSMKLLQYDYYGTPAVCPCSVVGDYPARFGYVPGDPESIVAAIKAAVRAPHRRTRQCLDWSQVADRLVAPEKFADTQLLR